jgi:hypothetical protein
VLVSLGNELGLLKPGMNGEVSVLIERKENVLTVSNDAVRTVREAAASAAALGLDADSVQAQIRAQFAAGGMSGMGGATNGARPNVSRGEVALATDQGQQGQGGGQRGGRGDFQMPEVTEKQCADVRAAFAKKPDAQQKLDALRERVRSGEIDFQAMREESQKIYGDVGVDARVAGACRMRERGGAGGQGGMAGGPQGGTAATQGGAAPSAARQGSAPAGIAPVQQGEFPMRNRSRMGLVFVAANGTYEPRVVRLGVSNFDYTEVISGVKEGEEVALLAAAALQARREEQNQRFRGMTGGGVPGMSRPPAGQGGPAGGGAQRGPGGAPRP